MRIVVRESMSSETVDLLLNDIKHAVVGQTHRTYGWNWLPLLHIRFVDSLALHVYVCRPR